MQLHQKNNPLKYIQGVVAQKTQGRTATLANACP